jgi:molybdopterin-synthase adenylyltransferase
MKDEERERYSRQILFAEIGEAGQERLLQSSAVVVGCGALGSTAAGLLVRAGAGRVRVIDRDFVEASNLQRQALFEEADAAESLPKAVAAERRLRAMRSEAAVEGVAADVTAENAEDLAGGFAVIVDGTDNFETRLLLNDLAVQQGIPWVYAAVVGSYGVTMTILPGETACLSCLLENPGEEFRAGQEATCDTAGVLNTAASAVASIEAAEAIKLLAGRRDAVNRNMTALDVWSGRVQSVRIEREADCRCCARREFRYLEGRAQPHVTMCGRDSVQIHERGRELELEELAARLRKTARDVRHNDYLLQFRAGPCQVTVFRDGRAIIKGTKDAGVARSLYARYIGS